VTGMDDVTHVRATCFYPRRNNFWVARNHSFNMPLHTAKELIQQRLCIWISTVPYVIVVSS
jgi:hypothetical protein